MKRRMSRAHDPMRPLFSAIALLAVLAVVMQMCFCIVGLPSNGNPGDEAGLERCTTKHNHNDPLRDVQNRGTVENGTRIIRAAVCQYSNAYYTGIDDAIDRLDALVRQADANGTELFVAPEFVFGIDNHYEIAPRYDDIMAHFTSLAAELEMSIVLTTYAPSDVPNKPNNRAVFIYKDGSVIGWHNKFSAPTGGNISRGDGTPFETPYGRVGILICADFNGYFYDENDKLWYYDQWVLSQKVDIFPQPVGGISAEWTFDNRAFKGQCYTLHANNYGGDHMVKGHSHIAAPDGSILAYVAGGETNLYADIHIPLKRYVELKTTKGNMYFELYDSRVPHTIENFTRYVESGFYSGLAFHHMEDGGMVQAGRFDPDMNTRTPTFPSYGLETYTDFWNTGLETGHVDGALAMYHPDDDEDGGTPEFYICDGPRHQRDGNYSVIGRLVEGQFVLDEIASSPVTSRLGDDSKTYSNVPTDPIIINGVNIVLDIPDIPNDQPPEYVGDLADTTVDEDTTWGLDLGTVFTDLETPGQLTFACSSPEMVMNGSTASWSPVHGDGDLLDVVFTATDGSSNSASSPGFDLLYQEVNDVPEYLGGLVDATVVEDDTWEVDLSDCFDDEESDDQLTFTCSRPEINITGTLASWSPVADGELTGVVFTAVDPELPNPTMSSPAIALSCTGINDPPEIGPLDGITVMEDVPYDLDLSGKVSDEETDALSLTLTTDSDHVTVSGLSLTFLYGEGDTGEDVTVTVSDGELETSAVLGVAVTPVNDPPAIADLDDITVVEDEPFELDISDMVSDPDSALADLDVTTDSDHVEVEGLVLTFLYPDGVTGEDVEVVVSDGEFDVSTTLAVTVDGSNDPPEKPVVDGISDGWTYTDEDTFDIRVTAEDVDGDPVGVTITSSIDGDLGDGQGVSLSPGQHTITVTATDSDGEVSTTVLSVKVVAAGSDDPDAGKDTGGDDITDGDGSGSGDDDAGADGTGAEGTGDGTGGEDGSSGDGSGSGWLLPAVLVAVAVVVAILLGAMYFMKGRGPGGGEPDGAPPASPGPAEWYGKPPDNTANQVNNKQPRM